MREVYHISLTYQKRDKLESKLNFLQILIKSIRRIVKFHILKDNKIKANNGFHFREVIKLISQIFTPSLRHIKTLSKVTTKENGTKSLASNTMQELYCTMSLGLLTKIGTLSKMCFLIFCSIQKVHLFVRFVSLEICNPKLLSWEM